MTSVVRYFLGEDHTPKRSCTVDGRTDTVDLCHEDIVWAMQELTKLLKYAEKENGR